MHLHLSLGHHEQLLEQLQLTLSPWYVDFPLGIKGDLDGLDCLGYLDCLYFLGFMSLMGLSLDISRPDSLRTFQDWDLD